MNRGRDREVIPIYFLRGQKNEKKVMCLTDGEFWFNNRNYRSKANMSLNELCIMFGKINCNIIYSSKTGNVDINLRNITDEFYLVDLVQYIYNDKIIDGWKYLNFNAVKLDGFNIMGDDIPTKYLLNLEEIVKLFDTHYILEELK